MWQKLQSARWKVQERLHSSKGIDASLGLASGGEGRHAQKEGGDKLYGGRYRWTWVGGQAARIPTTAFTTTCLAKVEGNEFKMTPPPQ